MSYISLPKAEDLNGKPREILEASKKRWGFSPNIMRAYSLAPEILYAENEWCNAVMRRGFLPSQFKEAIATVVSATNSCNYCSTHHSHAYTLAGGEKEEGTACQLLDFSKFNQKERIALEFVRRATRNPKSICKEDITQLQKDWTEGEIVEMVTVIQLYMGSNWFVTILGLELEEEIKVV